jgi:ABC-type oligopeptide transport system substrate-binding subunit
MKKRSRIAKIRLVGLVFTLSSLGLAACSNNGEKKSGSKGYEEYGSKRYG